MTENKGPQVIAQFSQAKSFCDLGLGAALTHMAATFGQLRQKKNG